MPSEYLPRHPAVAYLYLVRPCSTPHHYAIMDSSSAILGPKGFGRSLARGTPRTESSQRSDPRLPPSSAARSVSGSGGPGCRYRDVSVWHRRRGTASWIPIRHHEDFTTEASRATSRDRRAVALRVAALEGQAANSSATVAPRVAQHHDAGSTSAVSDCRRRRERVGEAMRQISTTPPDHPLPRTASPPSVRASRADHFCPKKAGTREAAIR